MFLNYLLNHVCNQVFYYSKRNRICMMGMASAFTPQEKRVYCDPYWGNSVGNQLLVHYEQDPIMAGRWFLILDHVLIMFCDEDSLYWWVFDLWMSVKPMSIQFACRVLLYRLINSGKGHRFLLCTFVCPRTLWIYHTGIQLNVILLLLSPDCSVNDISQ